MWDPAANQSSPYTTYAISYRSVAHARYRPGPCRSRRAWRSAGSRHVGSRAPSRARKTVYLRGRDTGLECDIGLLEPPSGLRTLKRLSWPLGMSTFRPTLERTVAKKSPNPIDKHVGARVRMRRLMLDKSQSELAAALGLTFQQVQKYEKGTNCVGSSRMMAIANFLRVSPAFFFEGAQRAATGTHAAATAADVEFVKVQQLLTTSEGIALMTAFPNIKNDDLRRAPHRVDAGPRRDAEIAR